MATKFFATLNNLKLIGDERDIAVRSKHRQDVWSWSNHNSIQLEYQGTLDGVDLWRVRDDQQRAWFALKWL